MILLLSRLKNLFQDLVVESFYLLGSLREKGLSKTFFLVVLFVCFDKYDLYFVFFIGFDTLLIPFTSCVADTLILIVLV